MSKPNDQRHYEVQDKVTSALYESVLEPLESASERLLVLTDEGPVLPADVRAELVTALHLLKVLRRTLWHARNLTFELAPTEERDGKSQTKAPSD